MEVPVEELEISLAVSGRQVSVDAPLLSGEDNSLLDMLANGEDEPPDAGLMLDSLKREISIALSSLTQRESEVIINYFGLNGTHPMTLEEIGEKFNLTRERVRQIKEKATRRLRHSSRNKWLKAYMG
jgi:RNA polymerase primary sigma factor